MDNRFKVNVLSATSSPQRLIWASAHQCVCEGSLEGVTLPSEVDAGVYLVKHLLAGNRGHFSPLEAPQISFNIIGFPHSTMQQFRTHRVGVHFSVQSFRYTGQWVIDVANGVREVEDVFYLRPIGDYTDRQGKKYRYRETQRTEDIQFCLLASKMYANRIMDGFSEEHARSIIPFDIRQNWVMSANPRSLMHILDLRAKSDAQLECQWLSSLLMQHFHQWCPAIAQWYRENRLSKARLSP